MNLKSPLLVLDSLHPAGHLAVAVLPAGTAGLGRPGLAFDSVTAKSSTGNDTKNIAPSVDNLMLLGAWE